jgi:hypothetical protein
LPISAAMIDVRDPFSVIRHPRQVRRLYDARRGMFPAAESVPKRYGFD